MPKQKIRDFLTIEQALSHALNELSEQDVFEATKRKKEHITQYADPAKGDRNISHLDSIQIDIALMKKSKGHPLLSVHQAIMDKAMEGHNQKASITQTLLHMGERIGKLMGVTEKAMDPNSPGGVSINKIEKENIYEAIKEVEAKIALLKKSIE
tara:strand:- start:64 stop:525 length:462 start_codon:yes stop_codon:yes gene_type:complete